MSTRDINKQTKGKGTHVQKGIRFLSAYEKEIERNLNPIYRRNIDNSEPIDR